MEIDKLGLPMATIVIKAPGRDVEFTGNIYEISLQEANARFHGYPTELRGE